jgi:hypothetical protein
VIPVACQSRSGQPMLALMFVVSEEAAAAIRAAFDQGGELWAAVELRRLFPGNSDNAKARECARTIAGWQPLDGEQQLLGLRRIDDVQLGRKPTA